MEDRSNLSENKPNITAKLTVGSEKKPDVTNESVLPEPSKELLVSVINGADSDSQQTSIIEIKDSSKEGSSVDEKTTEEKNAITQLNFKDIVPDLEIVQDVLGRFGCASKEDLLKVLVEKEKENNRDDVTIVEFLYPLKRLESLRYFVKLEHILETLECFGKPENIETDVWDCETSRVERWNIIQQSPNNHELVKRFLDSVMSSLSAEEDPRGVGQIVQTVSMICFYSIDAYFKNRPKRRNYSGSVLAAMNALEALEEEFKIHPHFDIKLFSNFGFSDGEHPILDQNDFDFL
ncbi:hypothetical protein V9T40_002817 [Parthenolecanium corni]|uniref:Uncharacterized protein n=1 Tax=Parthenolecanium corni TaxID=536013 RepID=A0AAN9TJ41_9HEMI